MQFIFCQVWLLIPFRNLIKLLHNLIVIKYIRSNRLVRRSYLVAKLLINAIVDRLKETLLKKAATIAEIGAGTAALEFIDETIVTPIVGYKTLGDEEKLDVDLKQAAINSGIAGGIAAVGYTIEQLGHVKNPSKKLKYMSSNGSVLETTPGRTTTVIGTYHPDTMAILDELGNKKSLDFSAKNGEFNLLNIPDELYISPRQFWEEYNRPWLDKAIARNDIIKIVTEPEWSNLTRINWENNKFELSGFGREYTYLKKNGYTFDSIKKEMVR